MELSHYRQLERTDDGAGRLRFTETQGSRFAKAVAGDFNPIHDEGSRRFCVPGDLLFAVLLSEYGVHAETHVQFAGMVDANVTLVLPREAGASLHLNDMRDRNYLTFFTSGPSTRNPDFVMSIVTEYVRFSGRTFPDILVGLMRDAAVMINPERPLVIYRDMSLHLDALDGVSPELSLADTALEVTGKKGLARLRFDITDGGRRLGWGEKHMVLAGLRPFDEATIAALVAGYEDRRRAWRDAAGEDRGQDSQPGERTPG